MPAAATVTSTALRVSHNKTSCCLGVEEGMGGWVGGATAVMGLVHSHPDNNYSMTVVTLGISQSRLISTDSIGPS